MKKIYCFICILLITMSCDESGNLSIVHRNKIVGSGNIINISKDYTGFTKVNVGYEFKVDISYSEEYSVEINIDDNISEYLVANIDGNELMIGLNNENGYKEIHPEVIIRMPDLTSLTLSGGCESVLIGFSFSHLLDLELSGGSSVVGNIETGNLYADLSGGSQINLTGRGVNAVLYASGGSRTSVKDFNLNNVNAFLSGASNAIVTPYGRLSVDLSGASILYYYGDPDLGSINLSGGSSIIKL